MMAPTEVKLPIILEFAPVAVAAPMTQSTSSGEPASENTTVAAAAVERAPPHMKVHLGST
jgi:hypothetical protein